MNITPVGINKNCHQNFGARIKDMSHFCIFPNPTYKLTIPEKIDGKEYEFKFENRNDVDEKNSEATKKILVVSKSEDGKYKFSIGQFNRYKYDRSGDLVYFLDGSQEPIISNPLYVFALEKLGTVQGYLDHAIQTLRTPFISERKSNNDSLELIQKDIEILQQKLQKETQKVGQDNANSEQKEEELVKSFENAVKGK